MTRQRPPAQGGLWGRQEPLPPTAPASTAVSNDLDLFAAIVRTAQDPGYVLIGPAQKPYVREAGDKHGVTAVPRYEALAITQMIDAGHLKVGGYHHVTCGRHDGAANSVLVPKATAAMVGRWAALHPLPRTTGDSTDSAGHTDHADQAPGAAVVDLDRYRSRR